MDEPAAENMVLQVQFPGFLLSGYRLVLHRSLSVLLSLICEQGEPRLQWVESLMLEVRVLIPLLRASSSYRRRFFPSPGYPQKT